MINGKFTFLFHMSNNMDFSFIIILLSDEIDINKLKPINHYQDITQKYVGNRYLVRNTVQYVGLL